MKAQQSSLTTIGFDADDTLWQNEHFYRLTEARFAELLGDHVDAPGVSARLLEAAEAQSRSSTVSASRASRCR